MSGFGRISHRLFVHVRTNNHIVIIYVRPAVKTGLKAKYCRHELLKGWRESEVDSEKFWSSIIRLHAIAPSPHATVLKQLTSLLFTQLLVFFFSFVDISSHISEYEISFVSEHMTTCLHYEVYMCRGGTRGGGRTRRAPLLKLEKIWFFGVKS